MFVYCAEILTDSSMGFVIASYSAFTLLESLVVNPMINSPLGIPGTFWIFSTLTLFSAALYFVILKETKGITKEHQKRLWFARFTPRKSMQSYRSTIRKSGGCLAQVVK